MCNDYEQHVSHARYLEALEASGLNPVSGQGPGDLPEADDIRVGEMGPVLRSAGNGVELVSMRFGFPPPRPRATPVFNFRSEGRHFGDSRRCLVILSAFFEFTGSRYPKAKHRFALAPPAPMAVAALWRDGAPGEPAAFAMLTTPPGPDVAPYHDRQVAVLRPADWSAWLFLTRPEAELLRPLPAGGLAVETVRPPTAG